MNQIPKSTITAVGGAGDVLNRVASIRRGPFILAQYSHLSQNRYVVINYSAQAGGHHEEFKHAELAQSRRSVSGGKLAGNGNHRRITKTTGGTTRHYYYSDQWQVLEERVDSSTTAERRYVWGIQGIDDLILRDRIDGGTERLYVLSDGMSVTAVVNTSGTVQERYGYSGFGVPRYMTASFGSRSSSDYDWETLFHAYRLDGETRFYQVRYRYLHPNLGRFLNRDPIEEMAGLNLYRFVLNNAVTLNDRFGLHEDFLQENICCYSEDRACFDALNEYVNNRREIAGIARALYGDFNRIAGSVTVDQTKKKLKSIAQSIFIERYFTIGRERFYAKALTGIATLLTLALDARDLLDEIDLAFERVHTRTISLENKIGQDNDLRSKWRGAKLDLEICIKRKEFEGCPKAFVADGCLRRERDRSVKSFIDWVIPFNSQL